MSKFPKRERDPDRNARIRAAYLGRGGRRGVMRDLAREHQLSLARICQIVYGRVRTPTS